ncbi:MAG: phosphotransferase [Acidimicrobiales bacterium]
MTEPAGAAPGRLIGQGRAADVYDIGGGRVLRRNRNGASTELEARVMRHVHALGFPVPEVHDAADGDLVMERLDGPTMLGAFEAQPWRIRRFVDDLADLHLRLEGLALPDFPLPERPGPCDAILHGDLHPDNVILTERGPVVIDWPNAAIGPRGMDAATTWVLVASSELEGGRITRAVQSAGRAYFVRRFLARCDRPRLEPLLPAAAAHRLRDPNVRPQEAEAIHRLVEREASAR